MASLFNLADLPMENLLLLQSACAAAIASRSGAALVVAAKEPKAVKAKEPKADKPKEPKEPKADKAPRAPGVAAAWLSHIVKARSEAYELYKASSEKKQGVALLFAKEYRAQHSDEYAAFELSFKEAHPSPKDAPAEPAPAPAPASPPAANPFDEEEVQPAAPAAAEAKKARKPRKPMTAEEKAAMAAKRAATMAAKKAADAPDLLQQHAEDVRAE